MGNKLLKFYAIATVLGVLVGLVGSSFRLSIDLLGTLLDHFLRFTGEQGWPLALISGVVSMLMALSAYLAVKYIAPEASGSGVPEVEGALLNVRPIFWRRLLPVKFFFGILAISSKMVLGREGPMIHIGGNLGEMLGEVFNLTPRRRHSLIASGAAAGLAVAFNAPLASALFVMEEMRHQFNYSFTSFTAVVISCITGTVVLGLIIGMQPTIQMSVFDLPSLDSLWLFALFGIVTGCVALLFNRALIGSLALIDKFTSKQRIYYVLTVGFAVGFLAVYYPSAVGGGMDIIHQALTISPGFIVLCFLLLVRFIGTMACYSTGVPGGIFAPMLSLGTVLGLAMFHVVSFLHLDFSIQPGMFAVAGMAAFFAASIRSPITGAVLVVEMTQNYSLIFPVMIACITSAVVMQLARNEPIYTQLLARTLKTPLLK